MEIGDIVNIKICENGECWRGKVTKIIDEYKPLVVIKIKGIDLQNRAVMFEDELYLKDGEYWEK